METNFTYQDATENTIQTDLNDEVNLLNHISNAQWHWQASGLV